MGIEALDGIPGLSTTQSHLRHAHAILDQVHLFKRQCSDVLERCVALSIALHRAETDDFQSVNIEDVSRVAERLDTTMSNWAAFDPLRSFLQRNGMKQEIHELIQSVHEIESEHVPDPTEHLGSDVMLEQDNAEIRNLLQVVISNTDEMQSIISTGSEDELMKGLQMELYDPQLIVELHDSFTRALRFLHEQTHKLPPLVDLTGQIRFDAVDLNTPMLRDNIYSGEWLGAEKVELRMIRSFVMDARKLFEPRVEKWRHLQHANILFPYGISHSERNLFVVQPWMNNGTIMEFLQRNPQNDRFKILNEIASGLEYLHKEDIIHGDLRGANVSIDVNGSALLSGFGIASFLEEHSNDITLSSPRWSPPELLRIGGSTSKSADVWSFAMTALELMTGQPPFHSITSDITVLRELDHGKIPDRPEGLSDELWGFMRKCWRNKPTSRPSAVAVNSKLLELRGLAVPPSKSPKKRLFSFTRRRPSTVDGASSNAFSGHFSLSSRRTSSPLPSPTHSTMEAISRTRTSSVGAVLHPESSIASRSLSVHSDRSESEVRFVPRPQMQLSSGSSTPPLSPDTDSDLQSATSGSSSFFSLPDSLMLLDDPATGDVYAGSVEGLVDKLLSPDTVKGSAFAEVFLSTFRDFTTPENLLRIIMQRFHDSHALQSSVFAILSFWLSNDGLHVSLRVLSLIKEFCLTLISSSTDAKHVFDLAEQKARLIEAPPPASPVSPNATRILRTADILPRDLAIALALLEGDNYWSILPSDYFTHIRKAEGPNSVEVASNDNNKLVLWVKKSILSPSRVETRAEVFKFFVNTAYECRKLRNFSSLSAITNALESSPIERLTLTVGVLSSHHEDMLQELKSLLDPSNNHSTYRKALKPTTALDPKYRDFCIPWLAVHLRDLHSLLQNYPPTVEVQGRTLVNFRRYSKFMEHVRGMRLLKPPDLERYRETGQLAYLQHQLRGVHFDSDTDVALMERSLELEADETRIHRTRALELKRLGFRS
ncbi:ras guanine nucleotide exchange factor domain-containing protein [Mycena sanguinolenta]|nr:ras guanine nucleotide exchange factor domain-containing protein [Mycena sanguinolenta]